MDTRSDNDSYGIRPLDARSIALSALLGTHPPRLPARALVALAGLFEIADGTMRTALSRMVQNGELTVDEGWYRLGGNLLDRQRAQDIGRRPADRAWDGAWHAVMTTADRRTVTERRTFRRTMADHRLGELRPDAWMRPANLPAPPRHDGWVIVTGSLSATDPEELAGRLWDLRAIAASAERLIADLDAIAVTHGSIRELDTIPARFETAAAVLRFLRSEPLLPPALVGDAWPVDHLRARYAETERELRYLLRRFFRQHAIPVGDRPV